jgi:hypothetical protein
MIDGRYPDITDVLGGLIGGLAGAWVSAQEKEALVERGIKN